MTAADAASDSAALPNSASTGPDGVVAGRPGDTAPGAEEFGRGEAGEDTGRMPDVAALADHARSRHVVVIGGGVGGLVAADELSAVGLSVTVLEASDALGGSVRAGEVAGIPVDLGAESFATRGGHVRRLIEGLGLGDAIVDPAPAGAWLAGIPGVGAAPLPRGGLLGIPANPWDPAVRRVVGWAGAWRAYLDRLRPPLTIGQERSLGRLVRTRMGARVLDRLVAPVSTGVYSARPDDIDVEAAAPGLSAALTRAGSLAGAVADLRGGADRAPGSAIQGIDGGMRRLVDALAVRLRDRGVDLRTRASVEAVERQGPSTGPGGAAVSSSQRRFVVRVADGGELDADAVLLATGEALARRLLAPLTGIDVEAAESPAIEVVTIAVRAPALDAAPRGSGVLTVPGSGAAKALTHSTAKWPWLAALAGPGVHVIRVSFGAQGEPPATAGLDDAAATALATAEASRLLGVALPPALDAVRAPYAQSQPGSVIGRADAVAAVRTRVAAASGLGVVGAWVAGTGLAQVVPDAIAEAERVRRAVLFGA